MTQAPRRTTGTGSVFYDAARGRWKGEVRVTAADGSTTLTAVTLTAPNNAVSRRAAEKKLEALKREIAGTAASRSPPRP